MCEEMLMGCWKLTEFNSDDFCKYMEVVGVSFMVRQAARCLKPDVTICKNENQWCIKTTSTFKNAEICFELDKEFDEVTPDGRNVKTVFTYVDGVLTQKQTWDGKESTITREVKDGRMITTCIFQDVRSVRIYDKK